MEPPPMRARRYITAFSCFVLAGTPVVLHARGSVTLGVNLGLNSGWQNNRWGSVVGSAAVPSPVDANGFVFASADALQKRNLVLLSNRDLIVREGLKSTRRPVE